jgi:FixJ family two-component response regulator
MSHPPSVISIVDDDQSFLTAVSRMLRGAGYTVQTFSSAQQYLEQMIDAPGCVIWPRNHMPAPSFS